ncbi:hypothetical protein GGF31_006089 [Allomyces arbusculus]|nr:hypothetical protein GGF31_006089 [Allomyces arbusculus]
MPWCSDDWLSCFQALFCYLGSTRDHLESLVLKAELEPIYMLSLFVVLKFFPRLRVLSVALDIGTLPSILDQVLQNVPAQVQQLTLSIQPFTGHAIMSCGITSRIEFPHALRDLTIELPPIRSLESEFVLPPNLERLTLIGSLRGENTFAFLLPRLPAALKTLALEFHLFGQSKNGAYKSLLVEYLPQHLESLTVYMGNLTFDDVTALAVRGWPTTLRRLDFRHNALVDLPPLFPPRLRYLGIAHNSMRESDGAWVAALPNTVRVIDLKAVDVKAAWIPHLLAWAAQVWEEHAVRVELRGSFYYLPRALRAQLQEAFMLPH